jgi:hypothetical protein
MGDTRFNQSIEDYVTNLIHFKARRLIGQAGYTRSDLEDIEQDLSIHIYQNLPKHDPCKGTIKTFINHILDNKIRTMVSARHTALYDVRLHAASLDEPASSEYEHRVPRAETIDSEDYQMNIGLINRPSYEMVELQTDVRRAVESLPMELQELCQLLQEETVMDIARRTGISRHKINELRRRIRFIFYENGLDKYL